MSQPDGALGAASARVALARQAQSRWAAKTVLQRTGWIRRFRSWLVERHQDWTAVIDREVGKSREECLATEILPFAAACAHLAISAPRVLAPRKASGTPLFLAGGTDHVFRRARGVIGIIGTWNYPLLLSGIQIAQALVAGNAVLFKPSEKAPECGTLLVEGLRLAGIPEGLVTLLDADTASGEALVAEEIDHLVFTGSRAVGAHIAMALAPRLVSSSLELSGHDALFVLDDADAAQAARAAWFGSLANSGRTCMATRRCLVAHGALTPFRQALAKLAENTPTLVLDRPAGALERAGHARAIADNAVEAGARWLLGKAPAGNAGPLILENVTAGMRVWREDVFVPLIAMMPCPDEAAMLAADAACPFALGAAIFGGEKRARVLASQLRAGLVTINDVLIAAGHPDTPIGGRGASGWGSTQGAEGLLDMTVPQVVRVSSGTFRPHYEMAIPGHADMADLLESFLRMGHAESWYSRFLAAFSMPFRAMAWWRRRSN